MKIKNFIKGNKFTAVLFVVAFVLLLGGTVGGIRAASLMESLSFRAGLGMSDIGITLLENGTLVARRDYDNNAVDGSWIESRGELLGSMLAEGEGVLLGKEYPEELAVTNSGSIPTFVRVILYRYWESEDGEKLVNLSPEMIGLSLTEGSGWVLDPLATTDERIILYYTRELAPGETTPALSEAIRIDPEVGTFVTEITSEGPDGITVEVSFDYDGAFFRLSVEADAVQTHNAADAIKSAWGRNVSVSGGVLTLSEEDVG